MSKQARAEGTLHGGLRRPPARSPPRQQRLRRILESAARDFRAGGELAVVFTGDRAIRTLNARYRNKDYATDVLSFPGEGGEEGLGDVVISIPAASAMPRSSEGTWTRRSRSWRFTVFFTCSVTIMRPTTAPWTRSSDVSGADVLGTS